MAGIEDGPDFHALAREGAINGLKSCLGVSKDDRVVILGDAATRVVDQHLLAAGKELGAGTTPLALDEFGERPFTSLPEALCRELRAAKPTVSILAAASLPGEIQMRIPLLAFLTEELRTRYGHMPAVKPRLLAEGMRADYRLVEALTKSVTAQASAARRVRATSASGTDVVALIRPDWRWWPCTGIAREPGQWTHLPEGETFCTPQRCDGVIVVDVVGDFFSAKYGLLRERLTVEIEDSRARRIDCENRELQAEFEAYLAYAENCDRVGSFALGTNPGLAELSGVLLQDDKVPGIHLAFGHTFPQFTGADWGAARRVNVIPGGCSVSFDGTEIITQGRYREDTEVWRKAQAMYEAVALQ